MRRLYVTVVSTIHGFGELFWADVVAQIDTMNEQVLGFQAQAKKLPKVCTPLHALHMTIDASLQAGCQRSNSACCPCTGAS